MYQETLGQPENLVNLSRTIAAQEDVSRLTPSGLADYHLAVTALQQEGRDVFLSTTAYEMAVDSVERTHHNLLIASADALTKEMIPGGVGGTTDGTENASHTQPVADMVEAITSQGMYAGYTPANYHIGIYGEQSYNKEMFGLVFAMRARLIEVRDDPTASIDVVHDIAQLSGAYFGEQRRMRAAADRLIPERGWLEFSGYLKEYAAELRTGHGPMTMIQANRLINAVHEGRLRDGQQQPMVMRFTNNMSRHAKAERYVDTLDATRGSYEDLLPYAGYIGGMLFPYLTGKKKSLTRLPSNQPVPDAFTHLLG